MPLPDRAIDHPQEVLARLPRSIRRFRICCVVHDASGCAVIPRMCTQRPPTSITNRQYKRSRVTAQSMWKKSTASNVAACAWRNCRQLVSVHRLGAGGIRSARRTRRIVDAPTRWPSLSSSPWIRWYPSRCSRSRAARSARRSRRCRRPSRPAGIRPLPGDQAAVPPQHGSRRDQPVHPQPSGQEPDQRGEDRAVGPVQPGPRSGAAQHGDLVPQHQEFRVFRRR